LTGLDEHQVRRWSSWHRWTILAMLAHAFLDVMTATARAETPSPQALIALTANEIRHCSPDSSTTPTTASNTCCTGHDGDAATAVRQSNSPDHELRLEH